MADPKNPAFVVRPMAEELKKVPTWGDPELLPKPTLTRPSAERNPFSPNGTLIPEGPDPRMSLPEDFLGAADLVDFPQWARESYDAWSTETFRDTVKTWLISVFLARSDLIAWDITEKATGRHTGPVRLRPEDRYLRIGLTKRLTAGGSGRAEIALTFPQSLLDDPVTVRTVLDNNALPTLTTQLDALY